MNKEQTARMIQLEERNAALAEEVQALEFEVKDKDKRIAELEEQNLNCFAELQQYKEPVMEASASIKNGQVELNQSICNAMKNGKYYRILVIEKGK